MYAQSKARPLLDMAQGVPGVPPPPKLLSALGRCAADPKSYGYCPTVGENMLRVALAQEMKSVYGKETDVKMEDITITAGCNMAFSAAIMSVAEAGDEVILPVPWSVSTTDYMYAHTQANG
jgi:aspartate/methionine/tyrosine aminotransferase